MEQMPEYINADIAKLSDSEFDAAVGAVPVPQNFEEAMEWALFLCARDVRNARYMDGQAGIAMSNYDGAWCINMDRLGGEGHNLIFYGPNSESGLQCGPSITGPINLKMLHFNDGMPLLRRWSTVMPKDRRGYVGALSHVIRERTSWFMEKMDKWYGIEHWHTFNEYKNERGGYKIDPMLMPKVPGAVLDPVELKKYMAQNEYKADADCIRIAYNASLTASYEWFVYVKEVHGAVGVKFAIDPSAAKEVFAMRNEVASGRKKALLHIVKGHQRNLGTSEEERITWVRKHLRGETKFMYKGAELHIIPSAHDIAMAKSRKKFLAV